MIASLSLIVALRLLNRGVEGINNRRLQWPSAEELTQSAGFGANLAIWDKGLAHKNPVADGCRLGLP